MTKEHWKKLQTNYFSLLSDVKLFEIFKFKQKKFKMFLRKFVPSLIQKEIEENYLQNHCCSDKYLYILIKNWFFHKDVVKIVCDPNHIKGTRAEVSNCLKYIAGEKLQKGKFASCRQRMNNKHIGPYTF